VLRWKLARGHETLAVGLLHSVDEPSLPQQQKKKKKKKEKRKEKERRGSQYSSTAPITWWPRALAVGRLHSVVHRVLSACNLELLGPTQYAHTSIEYSGERRLELLKAIEVGPRDYPHSHTPLLLFLGTQEPRLL